MAMSPTIGSAALSEWGGPASKPASGSAPAGTSSSLTKPLDDESTLALVRLFNAETGNWEFFRLGKPVTIIRPKAEFHGRENLERLMLAKAEFGERYLD